MTPTAKISGCFVNPTNPANAQASSKLATAAAESLGLKLQVFNVSKEDDFETAFASLAKQHADGLVIRSDSFYVMRQELLAAATIRHSMPAAFTVGRIRCRGWIDEL